MCGNMREMSPVARKRRSALISAAFLTTACRTSSSILAPINKPTGAVGQYSFASAAGGASYQCPANEVRLRLFWRRGCPKGGAP